MYIIYGTISNFVVSEHDSSHINYTQTYIYIIYIDIELYRKPSLYQLYIVISYIPNDITATDSKSPSLTTHH